MGVGVSLPTPLFGRLLPPATGRQSGYKWAGLGGQSPDSPDFLRDMLTVSQVLANSKGAGLQAKSSVRDVRIGWAREPVILGATHG